MSNRQFYAVPVIVTGLVAAVPCATCGCCAAVLTAVAALLAIWLLRRRSGGLPIEAGEGALVGALVGALAGVLGSGLSVVLQLVLEQSVSRFRMQLGGGSLSDLSFSTAQGLVFVVGLVLSVVMHVAMGAIGGALSTVILKTGAGAQPQNPY